MRTYKTELKLTKEQQNKVKRTIGVCRHVYNMYVSHNVERYKNGEKFINGIDFSKWLNNEYLPNNPDKEWIKEVSSKAVKQSILNGDKAFKRFFKEKKKADYKPYSKKQIEKAALTGKKLTRYDMQWHPKFKKKRDQDVKMYFVKTDAKSIIKCERHRIRIPTLGFARLKEYGYIPANQTNKSGTVSEKAGRFYVSVLTDEKPKKSEETLTDKGIGVDLGVKDLAVVSNGQVFENKNKTKSIKKLEKKLKREQRSLSRKYENKKKRGEEPLTINSPKSNLVSANIDKNVLRVQKINQELSRKRLEYVRYVISVLVKTKPKYITLEDLNVSGMIKNKHLSKAIAGQKFYYFRLWLTYICVQYGIEVRIADRFYPSSKLCCECGNIKHDLKLNDRIFVCECGNRIDRDLQASINLERCEKYKLA